MFDILLLHKIKKFNFNFSKKSSLVLTWLALKILNLDFKNKTHFWSFDLRYSLKPLITLSIRLSYFVVKIILIVRFSFFKIHLLQLSDKSFGQALL